jgi:hypothetical protein
VLSVLQNGCTVCQTITDAEQGCKLWFSLRNFPHSSVLLCLLCPDITLNVRDSEVIMAGSNQIMIFCDVTSCSVVDIVTCSGFSVTYKMGFGFDY